MGEISAHRGCQEEREEEEEEEEASYFGPCKLAPQPASLWGLGGRNEEIRRQLSISKVRERSKLRDN